jgi:hypothetical protein
MEGMPLRPVPARIPDSVNPVHALAQVEATLPGLGPVAQRALALVDLGAGPRGQAASELGVAEPELSRLLASARKALRRTLAPLPSGGWCERAERLISDRLDGALSPAGQARLDAHMSGCERCATHERKLILAHDLLVESYLAAHSPPRPRAVPLEAVPAPELRVVPVATETEPASARRPGWEIAWYVAYLSVALVLVALVALAAAGVLHVS